MESGIEENLFRYWIFLPEETIIPENWKPVFRMPETSLILLKWFMLVSMRFVKPSPRKRCEAGLINLIGTSRIFKAEISNSTSGFLWPDRQCNAIQIIQLCNCLLSVAERSGWRLYCCMGFVKGKSIICGFLYMWIHDLWRSHGCLTWKLPYFAGNVSFMGRNDGFLYSGISILEKWSCHDGGFSSHGALSILWNASLDRKRFLFPWMGYGAGKAGNF